MPKDYSQLSKEDLLKVIENLESRKKYGLVWDEDRTKEKFEQDSENAYPVLKEIKRWAIDTDPEKPVNIMIEGDNYHALSVLQFTHQARVDVIYIDPPYNTGKKKEWKFNDNWVDKEDVYRHSKWISFISKRLQVCKNLLKDDGFIMISIDDNELAQLKMLCDSIFGEKQLVATLVWNTEGNIDNQKKIKSNHEYILVYAKDENKFSSPKIIDPNISNDSKLFNDRIENSIVKNGPKNPQSEVVIPKNFPVTIKKGIIKKRNKGFPIFSNDIQIENYKTKNQVVVRSGWSSKDLLLEYIQNKFLPIVDGKGQLTTFAFTNTGAIYAYKTRQKDQSHVLTVLRNFGTTKKMSEELKRMGVKFDFPKPVDLISYLISFSNNKKAIVVDFFAGSGTTGHAVLKQNIKDAGSRKFIVCTDDENSIATKICYPRLEKVINGYKENGNRGWVKGLGGNLRYYKTTFVKKSINRDEIKIRIIKECTEMLCIREGIFVEKTDHESFKTFTQDNRLLGVYLALNRDDLPELKKEFDAFNGEKVLYCFTLDSNGLDPKEFSDWKDVRLEPIPQPILDLYEEIYELGA